MEYPRQETFTKGEVLAEVSYARGKYFLLGLIVGIAIGGFVTGIGTIIAIGT